MLYEFKMGNPTLSDVRELISCSFEQADWLKTDVDKFVFVMCELSMLHLPGENSFE